MACSKDLNEAYDFLFNFRRNYVSFFKYFRDIASLLKVAFSYPIYIWHLVGGDHIGISSNGLVSEN